MDDPRLYGIDNFMRSFCGYQWFLVPGDLLTRMMIS